MKFLITLSCLIQLVLSKPNGRQIEFLMRILPSETEKSAIGQIGGIDTDTTNNLIVFHRGQRQWSFDSFFFDNFNTLKYGPIKEDVLALINTQTSKVLASWGKGKFFMPHGLKLDKSDNIWLTDVGMHQVFKYNFDSKTPNEPLLTLGIKFQKGNDKQTFCKPTGVAINEKNGHVFVSDGYCNRRIVHFDMEGRFIKEFMDVDVPMIVVHGLLLIESESLVCAASREDGRIVCFDIESGDRRFVITHPDMRTVYAIVYDSINEVIHAATGDNHDLEAFGLTFDATPIQFGKLKQKWSHKTEDLTGVHDICLSKDTKNVYLGQLNGELDQFTYQ